MLKPQNELLFRRFGPQRERPSATTRFDDCWVEGWMALCWVEGWTTIFYRIEGSVVSAGATEGYLVVGGNLQILY